MPTIRWMTPAALIVLLAGSAPALAVDDDDKMTFKDLPKAVKKAVQERFPDAKYRGISKEKDDDGETVYEVEMTIEGKSVDVIFDDEGEIESIEKEIEVADLPGAVIRALKSKFSDAKIEKVEEVSDEDDIVVYEIALTSKGKKPIEVVMSPNGKVLEPDDDDDEDDKADQKAKGEDDEKGKKPKA